MILLATKEKEVAECGSCLPSLPSLVLLGQAGDMGLHWPGHRIWSQAQSRSHVSSSPDASQAWMWSGIPSLWVNVNMGALFMHGSDTALCHTVSVEMLQVSHNENHSSMKITLHRLLQGLLLN